MFSEFHFHMYDVLLTGETWNFGGRQVGEGRTTWVQCRQSEWQKFLDMQNVYQNLWLYDVKVWKRYTYQLRYPTHEEYDA